jgi:MtrB/PioB family decaheme-associated outer membrane protein
MAPVAMAADADLPVKAPVVVETPWWTHGFIELGGRGFLNDPQRDGHIFQGGNSLAKFYEYRDLRPGPFGDFFAAAGSGDGRYEVDVWGKNIGYRDQRYDAYVSKAGEQYFNFMWDQTPHVYSTSASTLFNTNGNALTLANPNIGNQIFSFGGATVVGGGALGNNWFNPKVGPLPTTQQTFDWNNAKAVGVSTAINQSVHPTDVGIRRDTASVDYRYTPTDNWDFRANYSNMRRTGSQVDSVLFYPANQGARVDVAKPIADTTQNFGVNGEYSGTSAWGQKFNAMVGYNGSVYQDDFNAYTVQNPFCDPVGGCQFTGTGASKVSSAPLAMMSTPPSNQMNAIAGTFGADLPLRSRYMGTVSYSGMRQNDQFLPFSAGPVPLSATVGGFGNSTASLPRQSLNGSINTLLINNVVTTQITPDLKTKLSYRYLDYDNQTPELNIRDWIIADARSAKDTTINYAPVNSLSMGYIKQNAAAEATWRPVNSVNIGGAYGYEHYDWTRVDASSTTENSGKVYADWKPTTWVTARASGLFAERRAGNYDYLNNVGIFQWPVPRVSATIPTGFPNTTNYSPYYRQFYLDDRDRAQAKFAVDVNVLRNLTVTPTFNLRNDTFLLGQNQEGLTSDRSYAAGVEAAYAATPDAIFLFSYMNEQRNQNVVSASGTILAPYSTQTAYACPLGTSGATLGIPVCQLSATAVRDNVNTFIIAMNYAVIPQKFDVHLGYTLSMANNIQPLYFSNGTGPQSGGYPATLANSNANFGQFPAVNTTFQRVEVNGKYVVDRDFVTSLGLKGEVALKLRYAWERNTVTNWNTDTMQPYMYLVQNQSQNLYYQAMAGNNPNYNVHLIGGSVAFAW